MGRNEIFAVNSNRGTIPRFDLHVQDLKEQCHDNFEFDIFAAS